MGVHVLSPLRALLVLGVAAGGWALAGLVLGWLFTPSGLAGALAGLGALAVQLLAGPRLVRGLLQVGPEGVVEEPRPYLVVLPGSPEPVITRGLALAPAERRLPLLRLARASSPPALARVLAALLALPCLLRAVHGITEEYGWMGRGGGPVVALGRWLLGLGRLLELPAVLVRSRFLQADREAGEGVEEALLWLAGELGRGGRIPTWMQALEPLAPLSAQEARDLAVEAAARGAPQGCAQVFLDRLTDPEAGGFLPARLAPHPHLAQRRAALRQVALRHQAPGAAEAAFPAFLAGGLGVLLVPGLYFGFAFVCWGLAFLLRVLRRFPLGRPVSGRIRDLVEGGERVVEVEGRAVPSPEDLPPGLYLDDGSGRLKLELPGGWAVEEGQRIRLTGWLHCAPRRLVAGTAEAGGRRHRFFPLARRLAAPLALLVLGLLWVAVRWAGI